MKKILALLFTVIFAVSLTACSSNANAEVQKYVDANRAQIESSFAGMEGDIQVKDASIIITIKAPVESDNELIGMFKEQFEAVGPTLAAGFPQMKDDCPAVVDVIFDVMSSDNVKIVTIYSKSGEVKTY